MKSLKWAAFVVEAEVSFKLGVGIDQRAITFQINLLVFDRAPQPFDEDIVEAPALGRSGVHRVARNLKPVAGANSPLGGRPPSMVAGCPQSMYVPL